MRLIGGLLVRPTSGGDSENAPRIISSPHELSSELRDLIGYAVGRASLGCYFQPFPSQDAMHALSPESYEGAKESMGLKDA